MESQAQVVLEAGPDEGLDSDLKLEGPAVEGGAFFEGELVFFKYLHIVLDSWLQTVNRIDE